MAVPAKTKHSTATSPSASDFLTVRTQREARPTRAQRSGGRHDLVSAALSKPPRHGSVKAAFLAFWGADVPTRSRGDDATST